MFATTIASRWIAGRVVPGVMLAVALAASLSTAAAQDAKEQRFSNMKEAMGALSKSIELALAEQGLDSVAVKSFDGPSGTSASSRIAQALTEQLTESKKVKVTTGGGSWSVTGEYSADMNKDSGKLEVFIESTLKNQRGRVQTKLLTPIITDQQETLTMFGVNANIPTTVTPAQAEAGKTLETVRAEATVAAIDKPQVAIAGPQVKTTADSPFAVEILVAGQPMTAVDDNGLAFVDIKKDQIYAIRLINNSPEEVGVALTIDGVNSLVFSKEFKGVGKWVIGPKSVGTITGWHFEGNQSKSFQVMDYGNSVAAQFASTKDIGTITAVFCACFTGDPPPSEPPSKGDFATGLGPVVEQKLAAVPRKFGVARASISVRYTKPDTADLPPGEPTALAK